MAHVSHNRPCSVGMIGGKYQKRISSLLLDSVDIFVEVPRVEYDKLIGESSSNGASASGKGQSATETKIYRHR